MNPLGNEQLQLLNTGVLQLLPGTDILLAPAGGTGIVTVSLDVAGLETTLDGVYIKRSPTGENQTIQSLTDNIGLTVKGFFNQNSDFFDVLDSSGALLFGVQKTQIAVVKTLAFTQPFGTISGQYHLGSFDTVIQFQFDYFASKGGILLGTTNWSEVVFNLDNTGNGAVIPGTDGVIQFGTRIDRWQDVTTKGLQVGSPSAFIPAGLLVEVTAGAGHQILTVGTTGATLINPFGDVVPLTIQQPTGGTKDLFDIETSGSTVVLSTSLNATSGLVVEISGSEAKYIAPRATNTPADAGYYARNGGSGIVRLMALNAAGSQVILGDPSVLFLTLFAASGINNADIPWSDFRTNNETDTGTNSPGAQRYHSVGKVHQISTEATGGVGLWKSDTHLWQTGTITGDGVNSAYAIAFANNQVDAAYVVLIEPDNVAGTALYWKLGATKANTGFTVTFNGVVPLNDTYSWYALRYGV